jgi:hypothetical protein
MLDDNTPCVIYLSSDIAEPWAHDLRPRCRACFRQGDRLALDQSLRNGCRRRRRWSLEGSYLLPTLGAQHSFGDAIATDLARGTGKLRTVLALEASPV